MKYQAIKHNKTGSRLLALCDTLADAVARVKTLGGVFTGLSYIGQFPTFKDEAGKVYSVQGQVEGLGIVCSLPDAEVKAFQF